MPRKVLKRSCGDLRFLRRLKLDHSRPTKIVIRVTFKFHRNVR